MKKKSVQKLSLGKATITNLNSPEMNDVKGGWPTFSCPHPDFCDTDENKCTTGCPSVIIIYC